MRSVVLDMDGWRPWRWRLTPTPGTYERLESMHAALVHMRRQRQEDAEALAAMMRRKDDEIARLRAENERLSRASLPAHVGMP